MSFRLLCALTLLSHAGASLASDGKQDSASFLQYNLSYTNTPDPGLQSRLEKIDAALRVEYGMTTNQPAIGLLDLKQLRLAMLHPDREEYAASVPKIGILLAYFQLHPEASTNLDATTQDDLGLMAKRSSNEMATKFSLP
jgi:hypothetical protein